MKGFPEAANGYMNVFPKFTAQSVLKIPGKLSTSAAYRNPFMGH
jgi:hypothetical protein